MLSRFISRSSSPLRLLTLIPSSSSPSTSFLSSSPSPPPLLQNPNFTFITSRFLSTNRNNGNGNKDGTTEDPFSNSWKITPDNNDGDSIFGNNEEDSGDVEFSGGRPINGSVGNGNEEVWGKDDTETLDVFGDIDKEFGSDKSGGNIGANGDDEWPTAEGFKPWSFVSDEKEIFDLGVTSVANEVAVTETVTETDDASSKLNKLLQEEEESLNVQLKGPNRAFGDLIAQSGITDTMIESLIALQDLEGIEGLPPLSEIEDERLAKNERKSTRGEMERKKQEEIAKSRVRQVDDKGRAYGTGRRKCSIARVWIQPGEGKFSINDKPFDVYFPILDQRAALLRPFSETKTLGLWDVTCTVKGGGTSGQVGAIRLGVSRALQNWEPGLRPFLKAEGFMTRDPRVVERKKPGKAKARKSFQWVKR